MVVETVVILWHIASAAAVAAVHLIFILVVHPWQTVFWLLLVAVVLELGVPII